MWSGEEACAGGRLLGLMNPADSTMPMGSTDIGSNAVTSSHGVTAENAEWIDHGFVLMRISCSVRSRATGAGCFGRTSFMTISMACSITTTSPGLPRNRRQIRKTGSIRCTLRSLRDVGNPMCTVVIRFVSPCNPGESHARNPHRRRNECTAPPGDRRCFGTPDTA